MLGLLLYIFTFLLARAVCLVRTTRNEGACTFPRSEGPYKKHAWKARKGSFHPRVTPRLVHQSSNPAPTSLAHQPPPRPDLPHLTPHPHSTHFTQTPSVAPRHFPHQTPIISPEKEEGRCGAASAVVGGYTHPVQYIWQ